MGSVAQAVLEFDEAVRVPWRPPLASAPAPVLTVLDGGAGHEGRQQPARPPGQPQGPGTTRPGTAAAHAGPPRGRGR